MIINKQETFLFEYFLFLYAFSGLLKWIFPFIDPTLLFSLFCVFAILLRYNAKVFVIKNILNFVFVFILVIHLCILSSISYTQSDSYYFIKTGKIFFNLIALVSPLFILASRKSFEVLKKCCFVSLVIVLILLFYELFANNLNRIRFQDDIPGESNPLPDYMSISYYLGSMILMLFDIKSKKKIILSILAFLFMILLAAKGPILFLILSILVVYWKQISGLKIKSILIIIICGLFFAGISILSGASIFGNLSGRLLFFSDGIDADQSSLARLMLFGKALDLISISPILGVGIGGFSKAIGGEDGRLSPHNIFLELWVEAGILPLIVFLLLIGFLINCYRNLLVKFQCVLGKSIVSICLYMFFGLLVSSYLEDLRLTYFWIGVSISYFALLYREKENVWN